MGPRTQGTQKRVDRLIDNARIAATGVFFLYFVAMAPPTAAYTQNVQLERELGRSGGKALALFPAKGFEDGAAGFFRTHGLYVVPDSQRAWCTDKSHGVLKPGCYVEFFVQGEGLKAKDAHGEPCGNLGRWYRAPGSKSYVPTPGPFISNAIANGEWDRVVTTIYDKPDNQTFSARSCDRALSTVPGH